MKMRFIILPLMILLIPLTAYARVGETERECQKRYGNPVDSQSDKMFPVFEGAKNLTYVYQGWRLKVAFVNDKAVRIHYYKIAMSGVSPNIKDDEASAILDGESSGGVWKEASKYSLNPVKSFSNMLAYDKLWTNSNGNRAYLRSGRILLVVESPEAEAFTKARLEDKERKRKESTPNF